MKDLLNHDLEVNNLIVLRKGDRASSKLNIARITEVFNDTCKYSVLDSRGYDDWEKTKKTSDHILKINYSKETSDELLNKFPSLKEITIKW